MDSLRFKFDLQLFADEGNPDNAGTDNPGEGQTDGSGEGNPPAGQQTGTILGTLGQNSSNSNPDAGTKEPQQNAGVPENYDFTSIIPEGMEYDAASAEAYSTVAKECGLSQEQASKIAGYGMRYAQGLQKAAAEAQVKLAQTWAQEAKETLGADYDKTIQKCGVAMEFMEKRIPGIQGVLNQTPVGNRIEMIQLMAAVGELVGESGDKLHGASGTKIASIYPNTDFEKYK